MRFGPEIGVGSPILTVLLAAFCALDLAIGAAVLARWRPDRMAIAQVSLILGYSAALTVVAPSLWLDPFGPLVKNASVVLAVLALAAIDSDR